MMFLKKYNNNNIKYDSFEYALKLAFKRNLKTIVETGTSSGRDNFFFLKNIIGKMA